MIELARFEYQVKQQLGFTKLSSDKMQESFEANDHKLCSKDRFTLNGQIANKNLKLQLKINEGDDGKCFQGILNVEDIAELKKLFQCNEGLLQYLKELENINVDEENGVIVLLGRHPIKKAETVQLYKINLTPKLIQSYDSFESILTICTSSENIKDKALKQILKSIVEKIQKVSTQSTTHEEVERVFDKIGHIGDQIEGIKMRIADLFRLDERIERMAQTQQRILEDNNQLKTFIDQFKDVSKQKLSVLDDGLRQLSDKLYDQDAQIKELIKKLGESKINQQKMLKLKDQDLQHDRASEIQTMRMLEKEARFFKHFVVRGINVTKQDDFIFPTILIGSKPMKSNNQFIVKASKMGILKKIYPGVCIGIVDAKHKHKQSCDNGDNVIEFSCAGKLFESNKYIRTQASGFEQGDIIRVKVNFEAKNITWYVNETIRCNFASKLLQKLDIDWRPYIFMRDKGDSIDWISK